MEWIKIETFNYIEFTEQSNVRAMTTTFLKEKLHEELISNPSIAEDEIINKIDNEWVEDWYNNSNTFSKWRKSYKESFPKEQLVKDGRKHMLKRLPFYLNEIKEEIQTSLPLHSEDETSEMFSHKEGSNINSLGIKTIPPVGEVFVFTPETELKFIKKYDLEKNRTKKQGDVWLYKGRNSPKSGIPCELYGYQQFNETYEQLVIKFEDGSLHCILHLHLREMQNNKYDNTAYFSEKAETK